MTYWESMKRKGEGSIPSQGRVRLQDVAAAAGVSRSTASRALAGSGASPETMAAVVEASKRLEYRPDPAARALRTRSTGLAGIVVPGISNPFFAELVEALEGRARASRNSRASLATQVSWWRRRLECSRRWCTARSMG